MRGVSIKSLSIERTLMSRIRTTGAPRIFTGGKV
jgi:hypothetical protein